MQEKISEEFLRLAQYGNEVIRNTQFVGSLNADQYNRAQNIYFAFRTRALNLIMHSCGTNSPHYLELKRLTEHEESANAPRYFASCLGIVEAARHDFDAGLLFDIKSLIASELLGDFIEQADALLQAGYHIPAASLSGAIIEDTLCKLCAKHSIKVPSKTSIDRLNSELARVGEYNLLTQKQITAYADIRNNADHGRYDQFSKDDVEEMLKWVRRFAEQHLS